MDHFKKKYGPWALVLGASEGLGASFADAAAQRGLHVAMAARRPEVLEASAQQLATKNEVSTRTIPIDLGSPEMLDSLQGATADLDIGLVIYNAAAGYIGKGNNYRK